MSAWPTDVQSPTGWSDILTNSDSAIQWTTSSDLLAPGDSLYGFEFDSTLTPAELQMAFAGPGPGTGDPVSTSFVYIAAPLADPGQQLVATQAIAATPEPATNITLAVGFEVLGAYFPTGRPEFLPVPTILAPNPQPPVPASSTARRRRRYPARAVSERSTAWIASG
jgi:hypothetical protein